MQGVTSPIAPIGPTEPGIATPMTPGGQAPTPLTYAGGPPTASPSQTPQQQSGGGFDAGSLVKPAIQGTQRAYDTYQQGQGQPTSNQSLSDFIGSLGGGYESPLAGVAGGPGTELTGTLGAEQLGAQVGGATAGEAGSMTLGELAGPLAGALIGGAIANIGSAAQGNWRPSDLFNFIPVVGQGLQIWTDSPSQSYIAKKDELRNMSQARGAAASEFDKEIGATPDLNSFMNTLRNWTNMAPENGRVNFNMTMPGGNQVPLVGLTPEQMWSNLQQGATIGGRSYSPSGQYTPFGTFSTGTSGNPIIDQLRLLMGNQEAGGYATNNPFAQTLKHNIMGYGSDIMGQRGQLGGLFPSYGNEGEAQSLIGGEVNRIAPGLTNSAFEWSPDELAQMVQMAMPQGYGDYMTQLANTAQQQNMNAPPQGGE